MPIYEYKCDTCKLKIERQEGLGETPAPPVCPNCMTDMKQIISLSSVQWKGGKPSGQRY